MRLPKIILYSSLFLFGVIAVTSWVKKRHAPAKPKAETVQEIMVEERQNVKPDVKEVKLVDKTQIPTALPEKNQIDKLFVTDSSKLDLVDTITYTSRVPWLKGRPAWIADYAAHFETTRHFIARSLNHRLDYFTQKVAPGDRFNVLKKNVEFHLLIDLSRAKMWFYGINQDTHKRFLLKSYAVGLGRKDSSRPSRCLTPIGKYSLGSKVAIYKPGTMGYFQDRPIEMIRVFGTRWIPFGKEVDGCSERTQGFGLHGAPWVPDAKTHLLIEDTSAIGQFSSDGCIRLAAEDIEEIFAIVISKPTIVELVKDFYDTVLPGEE